MIVLLEWSSCSRYFVVCGKVWFGHVDKMLWSILLCVWIQFVSCTWSTHASTDIILKHNKPWRLLYTRAALHNGILTAYQVHLIEFTEVATVQNRTWVCYLTKCDSDQSKTNLPVKTTANTLSLLIFSIACCIKSLGLYTLPVLNYVCGYLFSTAQSSDLHEDKLGSRHDELFISSLADHLPLLSWVIWCDIAG